MALRKASFKGTPFLVQDTDASFGRRNVLHKYPYRDLPFAEDLGRDTRQFAITAFVMDQAAHDALVEALESEGPGTLIHPWYGTAMVQHEGQANVQYPQVEGGRFIFRLNFVEAGENQEPQAQEDAAGLLEGLVGDALGEVGIRFEAEWLKDIDGWLDVAGQRTDALLQAIERYLTPFERAAAGIDMLIAGGRGRLSKPAELYYRIAGLIRKIARPFMGDKKTGAVRLPGAESLLLTLKSSPLQELAQQPAFQVQERPDRQQEALAALRGRPIAAATRPAWTLPDIAADARHLPMMPPSLADAVRRTLVLEQARGLALDHFDSRGDLLAARDAVLNALQDELHQSDGAVFRSLDRVQAQVVRTASARLPSVRELAVLHTQATLPAVVLAYQVNGTIRAYADVAARNRAPNPLFVAAGQVEVLRDG